MLQNGSDFPNIGIQLYTVRDELSKEPDNTIHQLSEIGYRYVEIADTGAMTISEFLLKIKQYNLIPVSIHIDFLKLRQTPQSFFNQAKDAGITKIVVPWIDPQIWQDNSLLNPVLNELEQLGIQAKEQGLYLAYHNHAHEFILTEQGYPLDKLVTFTQNVTLEIDIGWAYVATKIDPWHIIQKYSDRISLFHLKDISSIEPLKFTELGNNGLIDWQKLLPQILKVNVRDWIIEQDTDFENNALDSAKKSFHYLTSLIDNITR